MTIIATGVRVDGIFRPHFVSSADHSVSPMFLRLDTTPTDPIALKLWKQQSDGSWLFLAIATVGMNAWSMAPPKALIVGGINAPVCVTTADPSLPPGSVAYTVFSPASLPGVPVSPYDPQLFP